MSHYKFSTKNLDFKLQVFNSNDDFPDKNHLHILKIFLNKKILSSLRYAWFWMEVNGRNCLLGPCNHWLANRSNSLKNINDVCVLFISWQAVSVTFINYQLVFAEAITTASHSSPTGTSGRDSLTTSPPGQGPACTASGPIFTATYKYTTATHTAAHAEVQPHPMVGPSRRPGGSSICSQWCTKPPDG